MSTIAEQITARIQAALPGAQVTLEDLTGQNDHWDAVVISEAFVEMNRVARQRAVFKALGELMHGPIHALTLKTLTPQQAKDL